MGPSTAGGAVTDGVGAGRWVAAAVGLAEARALDEAGLDAGDGDGAVAPWHPTTIARLNTRPARRIAPRRVIDGAKPFRVATEPLDPHSIAASYADAADVHQASTGSPTTNRCPSAPAGRLARWA